MNEEKLSSIMKKMPQNIIDEFNAATGETASASGPASGSGKSAGSGNNNGSGRRFRGTLLALIPTVVVFFVAGILISIKISSDRQKTHPDNKITAIDTAAPTSLPTLYETLPPTGPAPTPAFTETPVVSPVDTPALTEIPTDSPTGTSIPAKTPTDAPTVTSNPTVTPTAGPTATPTPAVTPTAGPTATPTPAVTPTAVPTSSPTDDPSTLLSIQFRGTVEPLTVFAYANEYSSELGQFVGRSGEAFDYVSLAAKAPFIDNIDPSDPEPFSFVTAADVSVNSVMILTADGKYITSYEKTVAEQTLPRRFLVSGGLVVPEDCLVVTNIQKHGNYYPELDQSDSYSYICVMRLRYADTIPVGQINADDYDPGFIIPEGARFRNNEPGGARYLEAGSSLPYLNGRGYFNAGDSYFYGAYRYEWNDAVNGWRVTLGESFDKNNTTASPILDSICGVPVYSATNLFKGCKKLKTAPELPKYLKNMSNMFSGCVSLEATPTFPASVELMNNSFYGCTSLVSVSALPASLTSMDNTFENCSSLETIPALPDGLRSMTGTFTNCISIKHCPAIPDSVTVLNMTFKGCTALTDVASLPADLNIMTETFKDCTSLKISPAIPSGVTRMQSTFAYSGLIEAPVLPDGLEELAAAFAGTAIGHAPSIPQSLRSISGAFFGCTKLTKAPVLPDGITDMDSAFRNCSSLTDVPNLPAKVQDLSYAFAGCTALETLPLIPDSASNMNGFCMDCVNLTGLIRFGYVRPAESQCREAFKGTVKPIYLTGPTPTYLTYFLIDAGDNVHVLTEEEAAAAGF